MLVRSWTAAVLAALCAASPTLEPSSPVNTDIQERSVSGSIGYLILSSQPDLKGDELLIYVAKFTPAFCQQFQPVRKGKYGFKSWLAGSATFHGYTSNNCGGTPAVTISVGDTNKNNDSVNYSGLLSFEIVYNGS